jgi:NAD(P)-dependent dehydrogenase (short-subunit alcohol dehydrogenase family)
MFAPFVTVNAVCPGLVPSQRLQDIFDDQFQIKAEKYSKQNLTGDLISPESVAEAVLYLLGAKNITGQLLPICGGSSILPKF